MFSSTANLVNNNTKRLRVLELLLVLSVAVVPSLLSSLFYFSKGLPLRSEPEISLSLVFATIYELLSLGVLCYVLFRQGRSLRAIGLSYRWRDVPLSVGLFGVAYLAFYIAYVVLYYLHFFVTGQLLKLWEGAPRIMGNRPSIALVVFILLNPWFEELIVRAYTMSEITFLVDKPWLAVVISVGIQSSYHLYQGIPNALLLGVGFAVFSIYYAKSRRIFPVILAHFYADALSILYLFFPHR